jgi:hypothetical protein
MVNRDEYVQKRKAQIDEWNAELDRLQRASADAFTELMRGADRARKNFKRK